MGGYDVVIRGVNNEQMSFGSGENPAEHDFKSAERFLKSLVLITHFEDEFAAGVYFVERDVTAVYGLSV